MRGRAGHGYRRSWGYVNLIAPLGQEGCAWACRSGRSAAWLARLVRDQEVDGSNPFAPTTSFKANNLQRRKVPTTSWLCAKEIGGSNVLAQRSPFPSANW